MPHGTHQPFFGYTSINWSKQSVLTFKTEFPLSSLLCSLESGKKYCESRPNWQCNFKDDWLYSEMLVSGCQNKILVEFIYCSRHCRTWLKNQKKESFHFRLLIKLQGFNPFRGAYLMSCADLTKFWSKQSLVVKQSITGFFLQYIQVS